MQSKLLVVAIDGPANSGKGTIASGVTELLNEGICSQGSVAITSIKRFVHLDTGVLYRSLAYLLIKQRGSVKEIDSSIERAALALIAQGEILRTVEWLSSISDVEQRVLIRTSEVSEVSSKIAVIPGVRTGLLDLQRHFVANLTKDLAVAILDGRDIGSVVFPNAVCKIYVTASVDVRAKRYQSANKIVSFDQALKEITERDERDKNRSIAPLICGDDYVTLDSTRLSREQSIAKAQEIILESLSLNGVV
ncbi:MAG: (d)CMP kinase [Holosporales bacterium]|jgi:cytidylate kinase|nr:(d)CMP kinase [Holosporales bacterium]